MMSYDNVNSHFMTDPFLNTPNEYFYSANVGSGSLDRKISNDGQSVTAIRQNDVLCGRSKTSFNHSGNRRFRHIISQAIEEYKEAKSKWEKSLLAGRLVAMIHNDGGRFLKQKAKNNENEWYELSLSESKSKVSHAIRDAISISKQKKPSVRDISEAKKFSLSTTKKAQANIAPNKSLDCLATHPLKSLELIRPEASCSYSSSSDSLQSSDDESETEEEFQDDFLAYINKVLGPGSGMDVKDNGCLF